MARLSKVDQQKAKEAKQKKLLLALTPLLVLLLAIQGPKLLHHGAAATAPPVPAETTVAPGTVVPSVAAAPSVAATPIADGATASGLADTDVPPAAQEGQLVQFDLFQSKDPFVPQVKAADPTAAPAPPPAAAPAPAATSAPAPAATETTAAPSASTEPTQTTTAPHVVAITTAPPAAEPAVPTTAVAVLSVNGRGEHVRPKGDFPAAAPIFHLVSLDAQEAKIAIVGGSYEDGSATLTLPKGKPLTLMNTADGTRYVLVFKGVAKVPTASLAAAAG